MHPEFADKLLGGKGKYKKYLGKLKKNSVTPLSSEGKTVTVRTGKVSREPEAENIIGVVEGSDPVLKVV